MTILALDAKVSLKIAVYAISKNEEQFVERWAQSAKDAEMKLVSMFGLVMKV